MFKRILDDFDYGNCLISEPKDPHVVLHYGESVSQIVALFILKGIVLDEKAKNKFSEIGYTDDQLKDPKIVQSLISSISNCSKSKKKESQNLVNVDDIVIGEPPEMSIPVDFESINDMSSNTPLNKSSLSDSQFNIHSNMQPNFMPPPFVPDKFFRSEQLDISNNLSQKPLPSSSQIITNPFIARSKVENIEIPKQVFSHAPNTSLNPPLPNIFTDQFPKSTFSRPSIDNLPKKSFSRPPPDTLPKSTFSVPPSNEQPKPQRNIPSSKLDLSSDVKSPTSSIPRLSGCFDVPNFLPPSNFSPLNQKINNDSSSNFISSDIESRGGNVNKNMPSKMSSYKQTHGSNLSPESIMWPTKATPSDQKEMKLLKPTKKEK
ncbi:dual specificity protein kinase splA-like [Octopus sinensis]|uniref:Dual specificity protein kinase splA-like n=1 Tax=Octopus sinensis TaxID=2607531 RepID=A0A6P7TYW6_9MOLL|nr:dual specificity protein kinase splA-like [Octopus sinensis]